MSSRRDRLLEQMGITQYRLRRPQVLRGEIAVVVPPSTQLLIVANVPPVADEPLIADVLKALMLAPEHVFTLTPDQLAMISSTLSCPRWYLGVDVANPQGITLASQALDTLYYDANAKRALWQQICKYEQHFFTDNR